MSLSIFIKVCLRLGDDADGASSKTLFAVRRAACFDFSPARLIHRKPFPIPNHVRYSGEPEPYLWPEPSGILLLAHPSGFASAFPYPVALFPICAITYEPLNHIRFQDATIFCKYFLTWQNESGYTSVMPNPNMLEIVRKSLGLDGDEWARAHKATGISYHTIRNIAKGLTPNPGVRHIQALFDYYKPDKIR